jgi:hypothetical protein
VAEALLLRCTEGDLLRLSSRLERCQRGLALAYGNRDKGKHSFAIEPSVQAVHLQETVWHVEHESMRQRSPLQLVL